MRAAPQTGSLGDARPQTLHAATMALVGSGKFRAGEPIQAVTFFRNLQRERAELRGLSVQLYAQCAHHLEDGCEAGVAFTG